MAHQDEAPTGCRRFSCHRCAEWQEKKDRAGLVDEIKKLLPSMDPTHACTVVLNPYLTADEMHKM
jgi:hypothetical protein